MNTHPFEGSGLEVVLALKTRDLLHVAPAIGLLVSTLIAGCEIGSKNVGIETDTEVGSSDGGDDGTTGGSATDPSASSAGSDASSGDDSATQGDGGECGALPPIEIAACVQMSCIDGEWQFDFDGCVLDCTDQTCGTECLACPDESPGCIDAGSVGECDFSGTCVVPGGPDLCMNVLEMGFEDGLTSVGSCGDMYLYARNDADTVGLRLYITGDLVAQAVATGMPSHVDLDVTDPTVSMHVETGQFVTIAECTDVVKTEPIIDGVWTPTSGSLSIDITPDMFEMGTATIVLTDVVIENIVPGTGDPITIASFAFTDVIVGGMLPG